MTKDLKETFNNEDLAKETACECNDNCDCGDDCNCTENDNCGCGCSSDAGIIETLNNQLAEEKDKYIRAMAELENTRRRAGLDAQNLARSRSMSVAGHFLSVMDAIEAAKKLSPNDEGVKSMALAMESAFAKIGIVRIAAVGEKLNPAFHNAIQAIEQEGTETNTIIEEMQTGYMFGDTVMRTSMVVVAK